MSMRAAIVLKARLGNGSKAKELPDSSWNNCRLPIYPRISARRHFVGCIEEVDTGRELRFKSTDELLAFLAQCFETAKQSGQEVDGSCGNE